MTNNLGKRLRQHQENIEKGIKTFASRYQIRHLVYYEAFTWVQLAIAREKELKDWRRDKKLALIRSFNETFEFLEDRFWAINLSFRRRRNHIRVSFRAVE